MNDKIYTSEQMKDRELNSVKNGVSLLELMKNAGTLAAKEILFSFPKIKNVLILCGKGNNTGDAFVIARILALKNINVFCLNLLGKDFTELTNHNYQLLPKNNISFIEEHMLDELEFSLIIDGIFGTGFRGELSDYLQRVLKKVNSLNGVKIALDIPSGLNCDTGEYSNNSFIADITYVFDALKPVHIIKESKNYCGKILVFDIGIIAD